MILGASGFIGSYLSQKIVEKKNCNLRLFSRSEFILEEANWIQGSLEDEDLLKLALKEINLAYYCLGPSNTLSSWNEPGSTFDSTINPFLKFLGHAVNAKVNKVSFISSAGTVYGKNSQVHFEGSMTAPFSPYGIMQLCMENYLRYYNEKHGLNYDIFRISNPYGPSLIIDKPVYGVIGNWFESIKNKRPLNVINNYLKVEKDFIFIEDVAELLTVTLKTNLYTSNIYNIGSGKTYSIKNILSHICNITNTELDNINLVSFPYDNPVVKISVKKIMDLFSDFELTTLEDGLSKTWKNVSEK